LLAVIRPKWSNHATVTEKYTKDDRIVTAIESSARSGCCRVSNPLNLLIAHDPNDSRARTKIYRRQLHSRVTKLPHPRTIADSRNCPSVLGISLSRAWSRNFRLPTASLRVSDRYCPSRGASTRRICIRPPTVTRPSFLSVRNFLRGVGPAVAWGPSGIRKPRAGRACFPHTTNTLRARLGQLA